MGVDLKIEFKLWSNAAMQKAAILKQSESILFEHGFTQVTKDPTLACSFNQTIMLDLDQGLCLAKYAHTHTHRANL